MILRIAGRTWCGAVVDLRERRDEEAVDGGAVAAAVRGEPSPCGAVCPPPGPAHDRVGHVHPAVNPSVRTALAAAGRSRGLETPRDDRLAAVRSEIDALDAAAETAPGATNDGPADVERVGEDGAAGGASSRGGPTSGTARSRRSDESPSGDDVARLRERVAELRGRVRALEDEGRDADDERERLRETAARLSELTTERAAAVERRDRVRSLRDRRERRMRLTDREANLVREARAHLVDRLRPEYERAVDALGADADAPFEADPVTAALAVCRVADLRAPVVLAVDRFSDPATAADWLDAPVVRL